MSDLLVAEKVSKYFGGHKAVNEVSFSLAEGRILGVIGPNGAGKTTLFHCLAGFAKPSSGRIFLNGHDVAGQRPDQVFAAGVARTFQIPKLFLEMSVVDNVMAAARLQAGEAFVECLDAAGAGAAAGASFAGASIVLAEIRRPR